MVTGDQRVDVALAEYAALRSEIDRRSQAQQTLANLALTLSGALVAYAITNDAIGILLLQPIVASSLGMLYADHGSAIRRLGRYLDRSVAVSVSAAVGDPCVMRWESLAARREGVWRFFWLVPPLIVFVFSSAVVLASSLSGRVLPTIARDSHLLRLPAWVFFVLWLAGLMMVLISAFAFYGAYAKGMLTGFDEALGIDPPAESARAIEDDDD